MNTPNKCARCTHCQYDVMTEDNCTSSAWCELASCNFGDENCKKFKDYKPEKRGEHGGSKGN